MLKTRIPLISAAAFVLLVSWGQAGDDLYPPSTIIIKHHTNWTKKHYPKRVALFKKRPLKMGEIVFLGDSITEQGRDWSKRFGMPNIRNRGIPGDVTDGVIARLGEVVHFKPKAVFLLIGINDLYFTRLSNEYVANNIIRIAKTIREKSPKTPVFVQTILPIKRKHLLPKITGVNKILRDNANKGIYTLIDLYPHFANEDGVIKPELTSDGIHLSQAGYKVWIEQVKALVKDPRSAKRSTRRSKRR